MQSPGGLQIASCVKCYDLLVDHVALEIKAEEEESGFFIQRRFGDLKSTMSWHFWERLAPETIAHLSEVFLGGKNGIEEYINGSNVLLEFGDCWRPVDGRYCKHAKPDLHDSKAAKKIIRALVTHEFKQASLR